ncbi:hypothetical protein RHMOL_Rhmol12G0237500 [Rhododendron molle]|uniref:Uncharacterized protein n=1 Tax=Rhododendron molle TaxID=49168 RepID=A0ACC0LMP8_RHOML|nr:hypothetical protein RHMOL_Rhmol12G0237500 [Rhododendron molle]
MKQLVMGKLTLRKPIHQHAKGKGTFNYPQSAPKFGTTWLKALAFAIVTRTEFDFSANPLLVKVLHDCVPMLEVRPEIGFLPMEVVFEPFCKGVSFYGPYWDHVLGHPFSAAEGIEGVVKRVMDLCSFENLKKFEVNKKGSHWVDTLVAIENNTYFTRGRVGDWKNHLAEEMV